MKKTLLNIINTILTEKHDKFTKEEIVIFTGKLLCQSLFFHKVADLRNFAKFLRTPFLIEHLWVAAFEESCPEINVQIAI